MDGLQVVKVSLGFEGRVRWSVKAENQLKLLMEAAKLMDKANFSLVIEFAGTKKNTFLFLDVTDEETKLGILSADPLSINVDEEETSEEQPSNTESLSPT